MSRYLKAFVLSAAVALPCGVPCFGGWFWCHVCKKPVLDKNWGSHGVDLHKGELGAPKFHWCLECREPHPYQSQGEGIIHWHESMNPLGYGFLCPRCKKAIKANSWIMHLWRECNIPIFKEVFRNMWTGELKARSTETVALSTFWCSECEEAKKLCEFPNECKYDHLRNEHSDYLSDRELYCRLCGKVISEENWNAHIKAKHKDNLNRGRFSCPACGKITKEIYEEHIKKYHKNQCLFCKESVSEKTREEHVRKKHGIFCPLCKEQIYKVPLEVHIEREHEVWEGTCKHWKLCQKPISPDGTMQIKKSKIAKYLKPLTSKTEISEHSFDTGDAIDDEKEYVLGRFRKDEEGAPSIYIKNYGVNVPLLMYLKDHASDMCQKHCEEWKKCEQEKDDQKKKALWIEMYSKYSEGIGVCSATKNASVLRVPNILLYPSGAENRNAPCVCLRIPAVVCIGMKSARDPVG